MYGWTEHLGPTWGPYHYSPVEVHIDPIYVLLGRTARWVPYGSHINNCPDIAHKYIVPMCIFGKNMWVPHRAHIMNCQYGAHVDPLCIVGQNTWDPRGAHIINSPVNWSPHLSRMYCWLEHMGPMWDPCHY